MITVRQRMSSNEPLNHTCPPQDEMQSISDPLQSIKSVNGPIFWFMME